MRKLHKILSFCSAKVADYFVSDVAVRSKAKSYIEELLSDTQTKTIVLVFTHRWGGGIERHLSDKARKLKREGCLLILLRPSKYISSNVELGAFEPMVFPSLRSIHWPILVDIFNGFPIKFIEVHSLMGWQFSALSKIDELTQKLSIHYDYYVHDFMSICPQIHLVDYTSWYCEEKGEDSCRTCMSKMDNPRIKAHLPPFPHGKKIDILEWRSSYRKLLSNARQIIAPSQDSARRIERYYPGLSVTVIPHLDTSNFIPQNIVAVYSPETKIRVALIGAIRSAKGSRVLLDCAIDALQRKLPIEFIVIGTLNMKSKFQKLSNVVVTGRYSDMEVYNLIRNQGCHVAFLPSVCPETFSYTLSIALNAGFHCFVFDIGAQAERLRDLGRGTILPMTSMLDPSDVNNAIMDHFFPHMVIAQ